MNEKGSHARRAHPFSGSGGKPHPDTLPPTYLFSTFPHSLGPLTRLFSPLITKQGEDDGEAGEMAARASKEAVVRQRGCRLAAFGGPDSRADVAEDAASLDQRQIDAVRDGEEKVDAEFGAEGKTGSVRSRVRSRVRRGK